MPVLSAARLPTTPTSQLGSLPLHGCCWPKQTLPSVHVCLDVTHAGRGRRGRTPTSHPRGGTTLLSSATSSSDASDTGPFTHPRCATRQADRLWSFRCCLVRKLSYILRENMTTISSDLGYVLMLNLENNHLCEVMYGFHVHPLKFLLHVTYFIKLA